MITIGFNKSPKNEKKTMGCQIPWMGEVQYALNPYHGTKPWVVKYNGWERVASPFNAFMMNGRGRPLHLMCL